MDPIPVPHTPVPAAAPAPRPVWQIFLVFGVAVSAMIAGGLAVTIGVMVANGRLRDLSIPELLGLPGYLPLSVASTELALGVIVFGALKLMREGPSVSERLQLNRARVRLGDIVLLMLGLVGLGHGAQALAQMAGIHSELLETMPGVVRAMSPSGLAFLLLVGTAGAGVCEELFFRGFAQPPLVERFGPRVGVLISAAMFGAIHADVLHSPLAFLMGLVLGWAAWRSGTVLTGVVAHTLNNLLGFVTMRLAGDVPSPGPWADALGGLAVGAIAVTILSARWRAGPAAALQPDRAG